MPADEKIKQIQDDACLKELFASLDDVKVDKAMLDSSLSYVLSAAKDLAENTAITNEEKPDKAAIIEMPRKSKKGAKRIRRRNVWRIAAAACMVFALTGGTAYATPVSYYDFEQDGNSISIGMNCFGRIVDVDAEGDVGFEITSSMNLMHRPGDDGVMMILDSMEQHDPEHEIGYGPRDGEKKKIEPRTPANADVDMSAENTLTNTASNREGVSIGDSEGLNAKGNFEERDSTMPSDMHENNQSEFGKPPTSSIQETGTEEKTSIFPTKSYTSKTLPSDDKNINPNVGQFRENMPDGTDAYGGYQHTGGDGQPL